MSNDLISRQAAIDEIDEWIKAFQENGHKESSADARLIQDGIIQLPSAQPEIVRCGECKYYQKVYGGLPLGEVGHCICHSFETVPDWYCADGEKKEE